MLGLLSESGGAVLALGLFGLVAVVLAARAYRHLSKGGARRRSRRERERLRRDFWGWG